MQLQSSKEVWSITQLNQYLAKTIDSVEKLKRLWLEGEISNFSQHMGSKHMYFTLKDGNSKVKAAMFASNNRRLRFIPRDGDKVIVKGHVAIYDREGQIQFYVQDMKLSGTGDLFAAFERLKDQLAEEGLFSKERLALPVLPRAIGVVTSATGAAIRDIITTLKRRYPLARVLLFPVSVQGDYAAEEIEFAISAFNKRLDVDLIIVGRGGGSLEELWPFNEERVARAVYNSKLPVISAVGHETDTVIIDFVADMRAATPTAAAELASPELNLYRAQIRDLTSSLVRLMKMKLKLSRERIERTRQKITLLGDSSRILLQRIEHFNKLKMRLLYVSRAYVKSQADKHLSLMLKLDSLSPLKVLARGYSLAYYNRDLLSSVQRVARDDIIRVRLLDGRLTCQIKEVEMQPKDD